MARRRRYKPRIVRMPVGEPKAGLTHEDMALVARSAAEHRARGHQGSLPQAFLLLEDWCLPRDIDPIVSKLTGST